jgi:hypothetical protein
MSDQELYQALLDNHLPLVARSDLPDPPETTLPRFPKPVASTAVEIRPVALTTALRDF